MRFSCFASVLLPCGGPAAGLLELDNEVVAVVFSCKKRNTRCSNDTHVRSSGDMNVQEMTVTHTEMTHVEQITHDPTIRRLIN